MKMRNEIVVDAPVGRVYALASSTEQWPQFLPHYRFVRVLSGDRTRRSIRMGALRWFGVVPLPVSWRAEQVNDEQKPEVFFLHTGGWTRGMHVYWRFTPMQYGTATHVAIDHELRSPLANFIGKWFVDPIATRTLNCMKILAETRAER